MGQAAASPSAQIVCPSICLVISCNSKNHYLKHIDFSVVSLPNFKPVHHVNQPRGTFPAGSALSAALMLIKLGQPENGLDYISGIIHDDDCSCSESALLIPQRVEVHKHLLADLLWEETD